MLKTDFVFALPPFPAALLPALLPTGLCPVVLLVVELVCFVALWSVFGAILLLPAGLVL